jgi:ATP-dependent protease HslVU (ClpYQ) peptidase subunit
MTTIAYKDGVIACDSRITQGSSIVDDDFDKRVIRDGVQFFFSGPTSDYENLIAAYFGAELRTPCDAAALVYDGASLQFIAAEDGKAFFKSPRRINNPCAIGSGADHALTAMDMGAEAAYAVEVAAKRDSATGGVVKVYRLGVE